VLTESAVWALAPVHAEKIVASAKTANPKIKFELLAYVYLRLLVRVNVDVANKSCLQMRIDLLAKCVGKACQKGNAFSHARVEFCCVSHRSGLRLP